MRYARTKQERQDQRDATIILICCTLLALYLIDWWGCGFLGF